MIVQEIDTPSGPITIVVDPSKTPPFRLYNRFGVEVDPLHFCKPKHLEGGVIIPGHVYYKAEDMDDEESLWT